MRRKATQREGAMQLVCKADDSIIAHGVVDTLLIVQLELEMIICFDVKINTSNSASVEGLARKRRPPFIGDLLAKAH